MTRGVVFALLVYGLAMLLTRLYDTFDRWMHRRKKWEKDVAVAVLAGVLLALGAGAFWLAGAVASFVMERHPLIRVANFSFVTIDGGFGVVNEGPKDTDAEVRAAFVITDGSDSEVNGLIKETAKAERWTLISKRSVLRVGQWVHIRLNMTKLEESVPEAIRKVRLRAYAFGVVRYTDLWVDHDQSFCAYVHIKEPGIVYECALTR